MQTCYVTKCPTTQVREASQSYIELLAVQMELAELELSPEAKILWTVLVLGVCVGRIWACMWMLWAFLAGTLGGCRPCLPVYRAGPMKGILSDRSFFRRGPEERRQTTRTS